MCEVEQFLQHFLSPPEANNLVVRSHFVVGGNVGWNSFRERKESNSSPHSLAEFMTTTTKLLHVHMCTKCICAWMMGGSGSVEVCNREPGAPATLKGQRAADEAQTAERS